MDIHYFRKCGLQAKTETSGRRELPPCQWTRVSVSYDPGLFTRLCVDFHECRAVVQCGVAHSTLQFDYTPLDVLALYQALAAACRGLRDHEAAIGMPPPAATRP